MKKKNVLFSGVAALTLFLAACGSSDSNTDSAADTTASDAEAVKIGVVSEVEVEVWEDVASRLEAKGIELESSSSATTYSLTSPWKMVPST